MKKLLFIVLLFAISININANIFSKTDKKINKKSDTSIVVSKDAIILSKSQLDSIQKENEIKILSNESILKDIQTKENAKGNKIAGGIAGLFVLILMIIKRSKKWLWVINIADKLGVKIIQRIAHETPSYFIKIGLICSSLAVTFDAFAQNNIFPEYTITLHTIAVGLGTIGLISMTAIKNPELLNKPELNV